MRPQGHLGLKRTDNDLDRGSATVRRAMFESGGKFPAQYRHRDHENGQLVILHSLPVTVEFFYGAEGGSRTRTSFRTTDFKS